MNTETFKAIREALDSVQEVLVVTHIHPDGDALGSMTAVGLMLKQLGKKPTLAVDGGGFRRFDYLGMSAEIQDQPRLDSAYELMIAVDCGDEQRMGKSFSDLLEPRPPLINIDHHITNTKFGFINYITGTSTSTTEMLFEMCEPIGVKIDKPIATSLLTGIVTDTLGFRTPNVTPRTLEIASHLMNAGADLPDITNRALNLQPLASIKLWGEGLGSVQMEDGLIWIALSNEDRERAGYEGTGNAGLVSMIGNVENARMSAVLMEQDSGDVAVGFRCRPPFDVAAVATTFGGGGHAQAAGCLMYGPLDSAEKKVIAACKEAIAEQMSQLTKEQRAALPK